MLFVVQTMLTGFLWCCFKATLSLCFVTENIAHGFHDNDLVVPIRLHHVTGHPVHHGRHFRRRAREDHPKRHRRRTRSVGQEQNQHYDAIMRRALLDIIPDRYGNDTSGDDIIDQQHLDHRFANFSLQAFGEHFHLHLTPYLDFLAPNYTLHYMGDAEKDKFKGANLDVPRHCFYSGHVNGNPDHRAVVSLCEGLVSFLVSYFICNFRFLQLFREKNVKIINFRFHVFWFSVKSCGYVNTFCFN